METNVAVNGVIFQPLFKQVMNHNDEVKAKKLFSFILRVTLFLKMYKYTQQIFNSKFPQNVAQFYINTINWLYVIRPYLQYEINNT